MLQIFFPTKFLQSPYIKPPFVFSIRGGWERWTRAGCVHRYAFWTISAINLFCVTLFKQLKRCVFLAGFRHSLRVWRRKLYSKQKPSSCNSCSASSCLNTSANLYEEMLNYQRHIDDPSRLIVLMGKICLVMSVITMQKEITYFLLVKTVSSTVWLIYPIMLYFCHRSIRSWSKWTTKEADQNQPEYVPGTNVPYVAFFWIPFKTFLLTLKNVLSNELRSFVYLSWLTLYFLL